MFALAILVFGLILAVSLLTGNFVAVTVFVVGLIFGSFLNVVIYRLPQIESVFLSRSHCRNCKTNLTWWELVPFFSFLILRGKCNYCGKPISWQYPLVETVTALLFLFIFLKMGISIDSIFLMFISLFLIVIFVYDFLHFIIPDDVVLPAIFFVSVFYIISYIYRPDAYNYLNVIIGGITCLAFFGAIVMITRQKGMGMGDVKLGALLGLLLPYLPKEKSSPDPLVYSFLITSFLLGFVVAMILMALKKKKIKDAVPFGPFLIASFYITFFYGEQLLVWYFGLLEK